MGTTYLTDGDDLTSVADAIRAKSGGSGQLAFPAGFVSEIGNIPSGGGGLTLLGSGEYTKTSYSDGIEIPVSYAGTPKEYYYYNSTPPDSTYQTFLGYNKVMDNSDLAGKLSATNVLTAYRNRGNANGYSWSNSPQIITFANSVMKSNKSNYGHYPGVWKWFIYGEAAT